jgi:hypothetical protein
MVHRVALINKKRSPYDHPETGHRKLRHDPYDGFVDSTIHRRATLSVERVLEKREMIRGSQG